MIRYLRPPLEVLVLAVLLALYGKTFLCRAFPVSSESMRPGLLPGDRVLVNEMVFGPQRWEWEGQLLPMRDPGHGDVVVLRGSDDPRRSLVRRVVAVGEERVEIRGKELAVEGVSRGRDWGHHEDPRTYPDTPFLDPVFRRRDHLPPVIVPPDSLFVLGDNRDRSRDSRLWGPVARDRVQGSAFLVYFSLHPGDADSQEPVWSRVRWRRTGRLVR